MIGSYYRIPNIELRGYEVLTHKPGNGAYRAPGAVQGTFAIESVMDELARVTGLDPIDLRLRNASRPGDQMVNGQPWPKMGLVECLERLRTERDRRPGAAGCRGERALPAGRGRRHRWLDGRRRASQRGLPPRPGRHASASSWGPST